MRKYLRILSGFELVSLVLAIVFFIAKIYFFAILFILLLIPLHLLWARKIKEYLIVNFLRKNNSKMDYLDLISRIRKPRKAIQRMVERGEIEILEDEKGESIVILDISIK